MANRLFHGSALFFFFFRQSNNISLFSCATLDSIIILSIQEVSVQSTANVICNSLLFLEGFIPRLSTWRNPAFACECKACSPYGRATLARGISTGHFAGFRGSGSIARRRQKAVDEELSEEVLDRLGWCLHKVHCRAVIRVGAEWYGPALLIIVYAFGFLFLANLCYLFWNQMFEIISGQEPNSAIYLCRTDPK